MTLAAGYKFEHVRAHGHSPILLISDSRYSKGERPYRDDGKKLWALAKNIYAVFAGDVLSAQCALTEVKQQLELSSSGGFEDLKNILKSSFDSVFNNRNGQNPHCILGAIAANGNSVLLYAKPVEGEYEVSEVIHKVIGVVDELGPKLREKINEPANRSGFSHPKHFMCLPDDIYKDDHDREQQVIKDARDISFHIACGFLEIVDDPDVDGVNPPLQAILLTPSGCQQFDLYDIDTWKKKIDRKSARANEVIEEPDSDTRAIVELDVWGSV